MSPLSRHRRLVLERELAVYRGREALTAARLRLARRIRAELARPAVLLSFFAAGVCYGIVRAPGGDDGAEAEDSVSGARVTRTAAALLAGARLLQHALRAAAVLGPAE